MFQYFLKVVATQFRTLSGKTVSYQIYCRIARIDRRLDL